MLISLKLLVLNAFFAIFIVQISAKKNHIKIGECSNGDVCAIFNNIRIAQHSFFIYIFYVCDVTFSLLSISFLLYISSTTTNWRMREKILCQCYVYTQILFHRVYWHLLFFSLFHSNTSGGLFDDASEDAELVFKYATEIMNNQRSSEDGYLQAITKRIDYGNEFQASASLCKLMRAGVTGILHGPLSANSAIHVQNICDSKEMPLLETRYDPDTEQPVINLHPHPSMLAKLYFDLVNSFSWESFTIIYESAPW